MNKVLSATVAPPKNEGTELAEVRQLLKLQQKEENIYMLNNIKCT